MEDQYTLQRPQLSEEEYLGALRAQADARGSRDWRSIRRVHASDPSTDCPSCSLLKKQRAAAAEQVASLSRSEEVLESEVTSLREELSQLHSGISALLAAADSSVMGAAGDTGQQLQRLAALTKRGARRGAPVQPLPLAAAPHSSSEPPHPSILSHDDVLVEGDGYCPTRVYAEGCPHGLSNVICIVQLPLQGLPATSSIVVATGGADRRVVISTLRGNTKREDGVREALHSCTSLLLPAPVLSIAVRPGQRSAAGFLAVACMDGCVHILSYALHLTHSGESPAVRIGCSGCEAACEPLCAHTRYATRLSWSADGSLLAVGSADKSLSLWHVRQQSAHGSAEVGTTSGPDVERAGGDGQDIGGAEEWGPSALLLGAGRSAGVRTAGDELEMDQCTLVVTKLQQLHFHAGSVEALAWCSEEQGAVAGIEQANNAQVVVDTLACAVRGSAALYYLRVLRAPSSMTDCGISTTASYSRALQEGADAQPLPLLCSLASLFLPGPQLLDLHLLLHRVPVSEDGACVDIGWHSLLHKGLRAAAAGNGGARMLVPSPPAPRADLALHHTANPVPSLLQSEEDAEVTRDEKAVHRALSNRATVIEMGQGGVPAMPAEHLQRSAAGIAFGDEPTLSGTSRDASRARSEQIARASAFIPVGFTIVDLSLSRSALAWPDGACAVSVPPYLAAAADNGVIYVHPWGSNSVIRRLVGHKAGGPTDAATRIAWLPRRHPDGMSRSTTPCYLAASSATENAIVVFSMASGSAVARLGVGVGTATAHTGAVRDICPIFPHDGILATGDSAHHEGVILASCGFDKRVLLWTSS